VTLRRCGRRPFDDFALHRPQTIGVGASSRRLKSRLIFDHIAKYPHIGYDDC
jgi:hypothetical protein